MRLILKDVADATRYITTCTEKLDACLASRPSALKRAQVTGRRTLKPVCGSDECTYENHCLVNALYCDRIQNPASHLSDVFVVCEEPCNTATCREIKTQYKA